MLVQYQHCTSLQKQSEKIADQLGSLAAGIYCEDAFTPLYAVYAQHAVLPPVSILLSCLLPRHRAPGPTSSLVWTRRTTMFVSALWRFALGRRRNLKSRTFVRATRQLVMFRAQSGWRVSMGDVNVFRPGRLPNL